MLAFGTVAVIVDIYRVFSGIRLVEVDMFDGFHAVTAYIHIHIKVSAVRFLVVVGYMTALRSDAVKIEVIASEPVECYGDLAVMCAHFGKQRIHTARV